MFNRKNTHTTCWMIIPVLALAATGLGYQAASSTAVERTPTVVKVFDLQKVFDQFYNRAVLEAGFKKLEAQIEEERKLRKDHVDSLIKAYDQVGDEDRDSLIDQLQQASGEAEIYIEFTDREKDLERSLIIQSLFRDIRAAVSEIATANNYDLVIASDEEIEINSDFPYRIALEKISQHRVYYANDQIDITEQIVTQMNLEIDAKNTNQ